VIDKTPKDQVLEIRNLLAEAQEKLDQVGYALRALQDRLAHIPDSRAPSGD
jgi:hypothetical protein